MRSKNESFEAIESSQRAVEVVVMWGQESVLHVEHLSPPRSYSLGEGADYLIGTESLGFSQWPLLRCEGGERRVLVPEGASVELARAGVVLAADRVVQHASHELRGARELVLERDLWVRVTHREFSCLVRDMAAEDIPNVTPKLMSMDDVKEQKWTFASAALHALLVLCFYFLPPLAAVQSKDIVNTDSRLVKFAIEKAELPAPDPILSKDHGEGEGQDGKAAPDDSGKIGKPDPKHPCERCKPAARPNPAPQPTHDELKQIAADAGIVSVLKGLATGVTAQTGKYSASSVLDGTDAEEMLALFGPNAGEARSPFGGLGPTGPGRGGGGDAGGTVGLRNVGTVGQRGPGKNGSYGRGAEGELGPGVHRVPKITSLKVDTSGALKKETIRRYIGQHVAEVRHCYEAALISRPDLQGRVVVNFMINPSGTVTASVVNTASTDLPDPKVALCIAEVVHRISFPQPDNGGVVSVSYPFALSQVGN